MKGMRIQRVVTALAAIGIMAGACGGSTTTTAPSASAAASATAAPKPAIKIGALIPLTGPSGATGQDMKEGYELAVEQINAPGGVNGAPIQVIFEDDKNDPATAVASWEKLVNSDKVEIMIGGLASTISLALVEPAKKAQVPMAWTGAAASAFETAMKDQSYFFHYHPWDYMNGDSNNAFLKSTPYKKFAIAYEDGAFGTSAYDGLKATLPAQGQDVVAAEKFKSGSTDFTAMLSKLKASGAEGFIIVPFAGDMIPMLTQMKEVGWSPKIIFASPPSFPPNFEKSPVAEGVSGGTLWTADIPAEATKKFVADFQKKFNKAPGSYWAPLAYTNLVTAVDALKKSGVGNKAAWIKAMEDTSYASPLGPTLKFTPSKVVAHQGFTRLVTFQFQSGKQQIVFPPELSTAKLK
jgi:branched-chain amino acid transport system substrate-binding protein